MKINVTTLNITFFAFFLFFSSAQAQNGLNEEKINKYLTSLPKISTLIKNYESTISPEVEKNISLLTEIDNISSTPISDSLAKAIKHPTYPDFINILKKQGFSSAAEWANVGDAVMTAYSAYHIKQLIDQNPTYINDTINDLSEKQKNINSNQFISHSQKELLTNKIQNSIALLSDPNYIDNENISFISRYIKQLNSIFKEYP